MTSKTKNRPRQPRRRGHSITVIARGKRRQVQVEYHQRHFNPLGLMTGAAPAVEDERDLDDDGCCGEEGSGEQHELGRSPE